MRDQSFYLCLILKSIFVYFYFITILASIGNVEYCFTRTVENRTVENRTVENRTVEKRTVEKRTLEKRKVEKRTVERQPR